MKVSHLLFCALLSLSVTGRSTLAASVKSDQAQFSKFLLGKDVKALLAMPVTKEGIDVYFQPRTDKRTDDRGIDLADLTKWLKSKGVGIEKGEDAMITNVKVDSQMVEIHFGGGGQGRRGSKHANKVNAAYKRVGGSRVNFRYGRNINDEDLQMQNFLRFMGRIFDVSSIEMQGEKRKMAPEFTLAIDSHTVANGMSYQMVLLSIGEPEQKKVDTAGGGESEFRETWYYLKNGHRLVIQFSNGKVVSKQSF